MTTRREGISFDEKIACLTLDVEEDYDDFVGAFNIYRHHRDELEALAALFRAHEAPLSAFIRTDLLARYEGLGEFLTRLAADRHCHSHSHRVDGPDSCAQIAASRAAFADYFGRPPLGYRAPLGILKPGDVECIKAQGFGFSASVFPSYRPGAFNNLSLPRTPFFYENGLLEIPFAAFPRVRYTISLSYLKLVGLAAFKALVRACGLPNPLVFDSHFHDYIVCRESLARVPLRYRLPWGRNLAKGTDYFRHFLDLLRAEGYRLITMTELYRLTKEKASCGSS
ncbi:MAG TPA: hypothetical protein PK961_01865 [bacterium]|nr:hypothetical protein [bacterium]